MSGDLSHSTAPNLLIFAACILVLCQLTLHDFVLHDLDGFIEVAHLNLDRVGTNPCLLCDGGGKRSKVRLETLSGFPRTKKHHRTNQADVTADLQAPPWTAGQRAGSRQTIIPSNNRAAGSTCGQNTRNLMVSSGLALLKLPAVGSLVPPDLCSRKP